MAARSKARKRAVDLLFEADQRSLDPVALLRERLPAAHPPIPEYTTTLVQGVADRNDRITEILATYSSGWSVERMPAVDRQVLKVGVYELLWSADVPPAVAIDEAVELVKDLSTDSSPSFVNGVLARVLRMKAALIDED